MIEYFGKNRKTGLNRRKEDLRECSDASSCFYTPWYVIEKAVEELKRRFDDQWTYVDMCAGNNQLALEWREGEHQHSKSVWLFTLLQLTLLSSNCLGLA